MKIALLNGSPKYKNSSSEILLADLKSCILEAAKTAEDACRETDILEITLHHDNVPPEIIQKLESADAWVFSCPLYVDGLPGHLLSCLFLNLMGDLIGHRRIFLRSFRQLGLIFLLG